MHAASTQLHSQAALPPLPAGCVVDPTQLSLNDRKRLTDGL